MAPLPAIHWTFWLIMTTAFSNFAWHFSNSLELSGMTGEFCAPWVTAFIEPITYRPKNIPWTWTYCFGGLKSSLLLYDLLYFSSPMSWTSGTGMTRASAVPYTCWAERARCKWCSYNKKTHKIIQGYIYIKSQNSRQLMRLEKLEIAREIAMLADNPIIDWLVVPAFHNFPFGPTARDKLDMIDPLPVPPSCKTSSFCPPPSFDETFYTSAWYIHVPLNDFMCFVL